MKYREKDLQNAQSAGIFSQQQLEEFRDFTRSQNSGSSPFLRIMYYGGGILVISAMTWLMDSYWNRFGPESLTVMSSAYFLFFLGLGYVVFFRKGLKTPGGLLFSAAIAVFPLIAFSLMKTWGLWPDDITYGDHYIYSIREGKWLILEFISLAIAIPILIWTKFPFHMFLISFALWLISMDIIPVIFQDDDFTWTERAMISRISGSIMLLIAYVVDMKWKEDYSFWLYLFALLVLTSGFSFFDDDILMLLSSALVYVLFVFLSILLERNVFLVFGTIGILEFLGRLSYQYFKGSPLFPLVLVLIGLAMIFTGIYYQKYKQKIEQTVLRWMPSILLKLKPKWRR